MTAFFKYDRSGRSLGVGLVTFTNVDDAERAKEEFDGKLAMGASVLHAVSVARGGRGPSCWGLWAA